MTKRKLRIGILVDSAMLEAWAYRMVKIIHESDYAEIALVIQNTNDQEIPIPHSLSLYMPHRVIRAAFNSFLTAFERIVVGGGVQSPDAFALVDSAAILAKSGTLSVVPRRTKYSDYIEEADLAKIRQKDLDVLIRVGFRVLRGGVLQAARFGVWSLHHGDNRVNRGGPPGYWEVMESVGETGTTLQILTEDLDNGRVIYRTFSSTHDMSLSASKNRSYWKSSQLIPRRLKDLHSLGADAFFSAFEQSSPIPQFYDRKLYRSPGISESLKLLVKKSAQKMHQKYCEWKYVDQWSLFYAFADDISTVLWRFKSLIPPKDRIWADPFVVYQDGRHFVFFEELLFSDHKGHIAVIELNGDGPVGPPTKVLDRPYHLSYPFIFEYDGDYYMVPESVAHRTVELYKCTRFPDEWTYQKDLMTDCEAADATLFEWNGKWWLFANMREIVGASRWDELYLFHADSPLSTEWKPHPRNPVISDVRSSRPAGRIFVRNGRILRPSQNSSGHYGFGFNICEIVKLDEFEYEENVVSRIEPQWRKDLISTHTFNYAAGLTVIDGQLRRKA